MSGALLSNAKGEFYVLGLRRLRYNCKLNVNERGVDEGYLARYEKARSCPCCHARRAEQLVSCHT